MTEILLIAELATEVLKTINLHNKQKYQKELYELKKTLEIERNIGHSTWDKNVIDHTTFSILLLTRSLLVELRQAELGPV